MAKLHALAIEDDEDILELISYNLEKEGFRVTRADSGEKGLKAAREKNPNLAILDLMLPDIDGFEVCRRLKQDPRTQQMPVIMVTAKGEETDVVSGLEMGADDYITKPFIPRVLIARVRAVLRRKQQPQLDDDSAIAVHDLVINPGRHEALAKGKPVDLTFTEFRILQALAQRPGWVLTREQIIERIRGEPGYPVTDRAVDVQILGLRRKLGPAGRYIETVRGVGYKFKE